MVHQMLDEGVPLERKVVAARVAVMVVRRRSHAHDLARRRGKNGADQQIIIVCDDQIPPVAPNISTSVLCGVGNLDNVQREPQFRHNTPFLVSM